MFFFFFYEYCVRVIVALINLEHIKSFETRRGKSNLSWIMVSVHNKKDKLAY